MFCAPYKTKKEPRVHFHIVEEFTEEIITLDEVKLFLQLVGIPDFDQLLTSLLIPAARAEAERYTGLSIGQRTIQLSGDWQDEKAYMPFEPIISTSETGKQVVGYTAATMPADLKLGIMNMIYIAFNNREQGLDLTSGLKLIATSRRRVGL